MDEKRQIKFRAWDGDESISHRDGPYIAVKAAWHPNANSRGYVKRHRLVIERKLGFYIPKRAIVHHKDEDKSNDHPDNLELLPTQKVHSKSHDSGKRNKNGHFVASEPIFKEIKFRLFNKNTKQYEGYDLSRLIRTTFRNSQFSFAGRFTGLKDKNGKEIYEGDRIKFILENGEIEYGIVRMSEAGFWTSQLPGFMEELLSDELNSNLKYEIVGHAYESES